MPVVGQPGVRKGHRASGEGELAETRNALGLTVLDECRRIEIDALAAESNVKRRRIEFPNGSDAGAA